MYEMKKHHFHYISSYTVKFTKEFYPLASFEIRPFEFCTVEANSEFIHNLKINFGRVYPQCYVLKPFALVSIRAIKQIHVYCKAHEQFTYNSSQTYKNVTRYYLYVPQNEICHTNKSDRACSYKTLETMFIYMLEIHACSTPRLTTQKCNYILGT